MASLNDVAKKVSGVSELTAGRTKLSTEDVITKYPNGVTIAAVDLFGSGEDAYAVINIIEDSGVYFFGGQSITNLVKDWLNMCGTISEVNAQLKKEPVKILLKQTKTKKGKDFTSFEVI